MSTVHNTQCLNCGAPLDKAFCGDCGQPASTHRMSFRHFLVHDVVHGIFHLDKGIIYTLKQVLTRPGKAVREYLAGRRVGYFNLLTLLLLLAATYLFLDHKFPQDIGLAKVSAPEAEGLLTFISKNSRWIIIASIFVFSASSLVLFRRARLNYTEHLILNGFLLAGVLFINILSIILGIVIPGIGALFILIAMAYIIWGYHGAFKTLYKLPGFIWRLAIHFLLSSIVILGILVGAITLYAKIFPAS